MLQLTQASAYSPFPSCTHEHTVMPTSQLETPALAIKTAEGSHIYRTQIRLLALLFEKRKTKKVTWEDKTDLPLKICVKVTWKPHPNIGCVPSLHVFSVASLSMRCGLLLALLLALLVLPFCSLSATNRPSSDRLTPWLALTAYHSYHSCQATVDTISATPGRPRPPYKQRWMTANQSSWQAFPTIIQQRWMAQKQFRDDFIFKR